ncbi:50S ribosomal protein L11 methyltransferase [Arenibaculum pallidiluteum]|uniref:50S ribosomal protein L11 methyltransferase n=1 Tax=Arenibaculum pallidiluteum TaxID=2812559 RepID=UPI001A97A6C3|nr:50S ribosomal protein L11 methyltransferase [Arenibaculum pallidiluteum]
MPAPSPALWRVALTVPQSSVPAFADALADAVVALSTFEIQEGPEGAWLVEGTAQGEPDRAALVARVAVLAEALGLPEPALDIEPLPALDWLTRSYQSFPPIKAGRFFVYGSHWEGGVPASSLGLLVDAATAFGSGEHATTRGCLLALDRLAKSRRPRRLLDMGCGSGILAMAMARIWHRPVVAVDIDEESVRVTRLNAQRNEVGALIEAQAGNGYGAPLVARRGPYDVIAANILARPLARMAPELKRHLAPGGVAVLSGLLNRQRNWVLAAHRRQGLRLVREYRLGDWTTLVLQAPQAGAGRVGGTARAAGASDWLRDSPGLAAPAP